MILSLKNPPGVIWGRKFLPPTFRAGVSSPAASLSSVRGRAPSPSLPGPGQPGRRVRAPRISLPTPISPPPAPSPAVDAGLVTFPGDGPGIQLPSPGSAGVQVRAGGEPIRAITGGLDGAAGGGRGRGGGRSRGSTTARALPPPAGGRWVTNDQGISSFVQGRSRTDAGRQRTRTSTGRSRIDPTQIII